MCVVVAGCGGVSSPAIDASIDGPIDVIQANCMTDGFDGTVLESHWSVLAGAAPPVYQVSASRLFIADAPFATTPSMPDTSWIYDLDTDKGNQIAWSQAIGGEDFTATADLSWSSTNAELTFAGIGVSDTQGSIEALVGMLDDRGSENGAPYGLLHIPAGPDLEASTPQQEPGNAKVKIQRISGMASISIDDVQLVMGAMPALISNVVIFYVRHRTDTTPVEFGSLEIREIQICRP